MDSPKNGEHLLLLLLLECAYHFEFAVCLLFENTQLLPFFAPVLILYSRYIHYSETKNEHQNNSNNNNNNDSSIHSPSFSCICNGSSTTYPTNLSQHSYCCHHSNSRHHHNRHSPRHRRRTPQSRRQSPTLLPPQLSRRRPHYTIISHFHRQMDRPLFLSWSLYLWLHHGSPRLSKGLG